jgi:hypothetical protein
LAIGCWLKTKSQELKAKHAAKVHFCGERGIPKNGDFNYQKKMYFCSLTKLSVFVVKFIKIV